MIRVGALRTRWRHVFVAAVAAAAFAAIYLAGVHTTTGQSAEESVLAASRFAYDPPLLALVSVPNLLLASAIVAAIGLLRRRWIAAIAAVAIIGVSSVLAQILKHGLLDRPMLLSWGENTFPSGHMTAFAAVAFALLLVVPARIRPVVAVVGALGLSVVGALLLRFGWHRPSDVFGAILLVTFVSTVAQLGVSRTQVVGTGRAGERSLAALSVVAAGLAAVAFVARPESLWPSGLTSPMLIAQCTTVAAVLMSVAATLWLLRHRGCSATQAGPAR